MRRAAVMTVAAGVLTLFFAALGPGVPEARAETWPEEWDSWGSEGVIALATELSKKGEAGKAERIQLAEYLIAEHLKDQEAATTRLSASGGLKHWRLLAVYLGRDLPADRRALWVSRLRAIYATPKDLCARRLDEVGALAAALRALGDTQAAGLVATWFDGSTAWRSLESAELASLAGGLAGSGAAGATARSTLAGHLEAKGLTDYWRHVVTLLRNDTASVRAPWAGKIRDAIVGDSEEFSSMTLKDVRELVGGLKPLDEAAALSLMVDWIKASTALGSEDLLAVAQDLAGRGDAGGAARQALAQHIETEYLDDPAKGRTLTVKEWNGLVGSLRGDLSAETQAGWAGKLRTAFTDPAALSSATLTDVKGLEWLLGSMGEEQTLDIVVDWIDKSAAVASTDGRGLLEVASRLARAGEAGAAGRVRLAERLTTHFLVSAETTRSVPVGTWGGFVKSLSKDLSAETRGVWVTKLRAAFVDSSQTLLELKLGEVQGLIHTLQALGDGEPGGAIVTWAEGTDAWRELAPKDLVSLAGSLRACGEAGKDARRRLANHVASAWLNSAEAARAIPLGDLKGLADRLRYDLTPDERKAWSATIRQAHGPDAQAVQALSLRDAWSVSEIVESLGGAGDAAVFAAMWFKDRETLPQEDVGTLTALARTALGAPSDEGFDKRALLESLEAMWLAKHATEPLGFGECEAMSRTWGGAGANGTKAQEWGMRAYEAVLGTLAARDKAGVGTLGPLGHLMSDVGLSAPGKGYPAFAAALARLAREGKLYTDKRGKLSGTGWQRRKLAYALGTPETRSVLQAELADAEGMPRIEVAKILSVAHRRAGELDAWQTFLDQRVASSDDADTKALWLMARAYAESVIPHTRSPLRGKKWLDQSLATAQSPALRLLALKEIVRGHADIGRHDAASALLDSVAGQFGGEETGADFERLREEIETGKVRYATTMAEWEAKQAHAAKEAWRKEIERRLESARQQGDQEQIQRYERLLGEE